ncbi:MAG: ABC transporter permease [Acidobacteriota bacterium]|nr:ABC transporter permease [Acidobacteriota bacterium]
MTFVLRMVWRETRAVWRRLLFFYICVAVGVGAIVAIRSIIQNVRVTLVGEARAIFGADVMVSTGRPWRPETRKTLDASLANVPNVARTEVVETSTMVRPERTDRPAARMVELKAVEAGFPFYGTLELESGRPWSHDLLAGNGVVVQRDLLLQLGLTVGERIMIAGAPFTITDVVTREPGRQVSTFTLGSRVFLDKQALERLNLLGFGSRASHRILLKTAGIEEGQILSRRLNRANRDGFVQIRHYRGTEAGINEDLVRAEDYLSLVGFVIVVLGGIGVWSVTRVFMQQKIRTIAILKCLGASSRQVLGTYVAQMATLSVAGGLTGVLIAGLALAAIPESLVSLLPSGRPALTPSASLQGVAVGLLVSILFALVPLLETRLVKPLLLLRADSAPRARRRDWVAWGSYAVVVAGLAAVAAWQAGSMRASLYVMGGLAGVGLALHLASAVLVRAVRPLTRARSFAVRHAIISLGRPGNQTRVVLLTVGLGAFFIIAIQHVQRNLLNAFSLEMRDNSPDMFLIDIQPDQEPGVRALVDQRAEAPANFIPVLRARVVGVSGKSINLDQVEDVRRRGIGREYVITYRSHLEANEVMRTGQLWDGPVPAGGAPEVSIEEGIAARGIGIGDRMRFDVAGRTVEATVSSIREVDWSEARSGGFMFVFRPGPLEEAPRTFIALLRAPRDATARAALQRDLVTAFPNVSAIDVREIIRSIQGVVQNITLAITIVGIIALSSGMLILIGAVAMTRFQRHYEAAVYRTLGASTKRIVAMVAVEYGVLGTLAGLLGALGAVALSWAVTTRLLEMEWEPGAPLAAAGVAATAVVVLVVGLVASLDVIVKKPLASLRGE